MVVTICYTFSIFYSISIWHKLKPIDDVASRRRRESIRKIINWWVLILGDNTAIKNWCFLKEPSLSDHPFISFNMLVPQCGRTSACPRSARSCTPPPPSLCDLDRFYELLPKLISELPSPEVISKFSSPAELDSVIAELLGTIKKAATCSKKTRSPSSSPGIMPWWSPELQILKSNFRNASEEKRENKTDETVERYRVAKQIYQRELRQAEKKSWEDLCSKELNTDLFTGLKKIARAPSQLPLLHRSWRCDTNGASRDPESF